MNTNGDGELRDRFSFSKNALVIDMRLCLGIVLSTFFFSNQVLSGQDLYQDYFGNASFRPLQETHSEGVESTDGPTEKEAEFELPEAEEEESPYDEPIETDRHDFTQSPKVVGKRVLQLEYGVFYAFKEDGTERESTYATPELLIRYGLTERLELRSRFNYAWKFIDDEDDIAGGEDLRLSLKYQLSETEVCSCHPESAVELRMSVPTGGSGVSQGQVYTGIDFIYGWQLGERITLQGSSGANGNALGDIAFIDPDPDPNDSFTAWTQSMVLGARLSQKNVGYFEWFGIFTDGREEEVSNSFLNLGFDHLVGHNAVIDFRIGWGLTNDSDDVFAGIGGAIRF